MQLLSSAFLDLMSRNTKIGIVTAAGYTEAERYFERLYGLLEAIRDSKVLTIEQKHNLIVMGKFSLFLFGPSNESRGRIKLPLPIFHLFASLT